MSQFKKLFFIFLSLPLVQGCAHEKIYDVEQIAAGGYIMRARASTWSEAVGTAGSRATQDATKYCQHEGRDVKIKTLKTHPSNSSFTEIAEVEFECAPNQSTRSNL